ncbi:MAG: hypothetical protein ACRDL7_08450, partial [Gaiellaceae bacterium]
MEEKGGESELDASVVEEARAALRQTQLEVEEYDISEFFISIGIKARDLPFLTQGGITEIDDLMVMDNEVIESLEITPMSKGVLRNYILWRGEHISAYPDPSDYISVTKQALVNTRRRYDRQNAGFIPRTTESLQNERFYENMERQSILLERQSEAIKNMADATLRKQDKPFVDGIKFNNECPTFSGQDKHWSTWKRKFKAFLGAHGLLHTLKPKVMNEELPGYDAKYDEKNDWLYHTLMHYNGKRVLSFTTLQKGFDGEPIPDG